MSTDVQQQVKLPFRKAVQIAWRNIRVRWWRSMLVTSGIILALAFLSYVMVSDAVSRGVTDHAVAKAEGRDEKLLEYLGRITDKADMTLLAELRRENLIVYGDPVKLLEYLKQRGLIADTSDPKLREHAALVTSEADPKFLEDLKERKLIGTESDAKSEEAQTWWLVGLALLVSFVGILNAMLMSVTERFAEIGTMKCLGALDGFIVKLFLLESVFQGMAGTAVGLVIGVVLSILEGWFTFGNVALGVAPWGRIGQTVGFCLVTGTLLTVAAGLYPAWRAARMQPVDAMRSEV
jgi:hypothetical protein